MDMVSWLGTEVTLNVLEVFWQDFCNISIAGERCLQQAPVSVQCYRVFSTSSSSSSSSSCNICYSSSSCIS